jgi:hypothetical protein
MPQKQINKKKIVICVGLTYPQQAKTIFEILTIRNKFYYLIF